MTLGSSAPPGKVSLVRAHPKQALLVYHAESVAALEVVRHLAAFLRDVCSVQCAVVDTDVGMEVRDGGSGRMWDWVRCGIG